MKIKVAARFITILALIATLTVSAALSFVTYQINRTSQKDILISNILKAVNQRRLLFEKYLRYHRAEHAIAWQVLNDSIVRSMQSAEFSTSEEQAILEDMREFNGEIKQIFTELILVNEHDLLGKKSQLMNRGKEEKLVGQFWATGDAFIDGAYRLAEINGSKRAVVLHNNELFLSGSIGILMALIFSFIFLLRIKIVSRLTKLNEGIDIISNGNLGHKFYDTSTDEIGHLNSSFNSMVGKLNGHILEIKKQQAALIGSSKMSALGEMAGGIAHEINNPLAIIGMKAALLKKLIQSDQFDKKTAALWAEKIELTVERIAKIIKGLGSFAREGNNDSFEYTSIKGIVNDALSLCFEKFKAHGITIIFEECTDDLLIECRAVQVSQVLLNFLNNAHDAIERLDHKWVKIQVSEKTAYVEISVTDSGAGIAPELREKVMIPFFTTKEIGKGTGLGLSISRGIIHSHQGKIEIDTQCSNTRFIITLPKIQTVQIAA